MAMIKRNRSRRHPLGLLLAILLAQIVSVNAYAAEVVDCDLNLAHHYGPIDFYIGSNERGDYVSKVVGAHFTPSMLKLEAGATDSISGDLDYTLRAIPNHPQALDLASRLQRAVVRGQKPAGEKPRRSVDCYFMRAIKLNPKVGETYYIWGLHYQRNSEYAKAREKYLRAEALGTESAEFYYNFGLLEYSLANYDIAKRMADKAYSNRFPLQGLRKKLKAKGYYK